MSVSGVNSSSHSSLPQVSGNENSHSGTKSATTYSIGYDRVSKDVYDRYDKDGDGRISKKEENEFKAEKSGGKSGSENTNTAPAGNLGNNIDLFA